MTAILLGRLKLTMDQALMEYAKLGEMVFSKPKHADTANHFGIFNYP